MDWITVVGAYGRTYNSQAAVLRDWNANKDFQIAGGGPYVSKSDVFDSHTRVIVRYGKDAELGGGKVMNVPTS